MFGNKRTVKVTVSRVLSPEDGEDGREPTNVPKPHQPTTCKKPRSAPQKSNENEMNHSAAAESHFESEDCFPPVRKTLQATFLFQLFIYTTQVVVGVECCLKKQHVIHL